jgi:hypothetical protein
VNALIAEEFEATKVYASERRDRLAGINGSGQLRGKGQAKINLSGGDCSARRLINVADVRKPFAAQ